MRPTGAGWGLQEHLGLLMGALRPRPSVFIPEWVAANGAHAAAGAGPQGHLDSCPVQAGQRRHCVLWWWRRLLRTGPGLSDTAENSLRIVQLGVEVSPSTLLTWPASRGLCLSLWSLQNTGTLELAGPCSIFVGGQARPRSSPCLLTSSPPASRSWPSELQPPGQRRQAEPVSATAVPLMEVA